MVNKGVGRDPYGPLFHRRDHETSAPHLRISNILLLTFILKLIQYLDETVLLF